MGSCVGSFESSLNGDQLVVPKHEVWMGFIHFCIMLSLDDDESGLVHNSPMLCTYASGPHGDNKVNPW